jgi:alkane 1-monooxygenase
MHASTTTPGDLALEEPLTPATWRDRKRYFWLLGLLVPLLPFMAWGLVALTGLGAFWFFGPAFVFGAMPILDTIVGKDSANPPDSVLKWLEQDRYYRWCTYLYIPIQYGSLVVACALWAHGGLSLIEKVGLALTVGSVSGIAINTAHELGHKRASLERWLSKIALAQTGYGHFFIEHNRGHHVRVATPEDPASSRLGESFYRFWPRTVSGSLRSSWELEAERLDRTQHSPWSIRNDILNAWAMTVVLFAVLAIAFGPGVLPFLLIQGVFGFSLLEVVNYLEHYGLMRQRREDGRYVRTAPEHSWNSNNVSSNVLLYHLQRHSDHHAHPMRRFQALRHFEEAPELPSGYATMIVLAVIPPLWRRVMDPRVVAHYDGDLTLANIQPAKRRKILARYGIDDDGSSLSSASAGATGAGATGAEATGAGAS